jgi:hypothetical protein
MILPRFTAPRRSYGPPARSAALIFDGQYHPYGDRIIYLG